jgi:hypothetical protein
MINTHASEGSMRERGRGGGGGRRESQRKRDTNTDRHTLRQRKR